MESDIDVPEAAVALAEKSLKIFADRHLAWDQQHEKRDAAAAKKAARLAVARERLQARSGAGVLQVSTTDADLSKMASLDIESSATGDTGRSAAATTPTPGTGASPSLGDREDSEKLAKDLRMEEETGGEVKDPVSFSLRTRAGFADSLVGCADERAGATGWHARGFRGGFRGGADFGERQRRPAEGKADANGHKSVCEGIRINSNSNSTRVAHQGR